MRRLLIIIRSYITRTSTKATAVLDHLFYLGRHVRGTAERHHARHAERHFPKKTEILLKVGVRKAPIPEGPKNATVKIISYGVPDGALDRACDLGRGAIEVAVPVFKNAGLIITDIAGGPGAKGADAIEARLQALGMALHSTMIVPHRISALAEAISGCDAEMILILTGSATSDAMDVAPEALRSAGAR